MDFPGGMDLELARNLLIAISIGALIGVERERRHASEGSSLGGVRTFTLLGMAGAPTPRRKTAAARRARAD